MVLLTIAAVVVLNNDGAWNWFQDERAIVHNGKLIAGSVAAGTHDGNRRGAIEVSTYDLASGALKRSTLYQPNNETERKLWLNDHNAPALVSRPDGRILAMYSLHAADGRFYYQISSGNDGSTWGARTGYVVSPDSKVVFPTLLWLASEGAKGRLYHFFRGFRNMGMPSWSYSDDNGESWIVGGAWIERPNPKVPVPYVKYAASGSNTIHAAYTTGHHRNYGNALYYLKYRNGKLLRNDGSVAGPLRGGIRSAEAGDVVYRAASDRVTWISDFEVTASGAPYVVYTVQVPASYPGEDHRYRYARWNGHQWIGGEIAYAGSRIHTFADGDDCSGLAALDPQDPTRLYISTNADPKTGAPLISRTDSKRHWEIFRGRTLDSGRTWQWTAITHNSTADNIRPVVPRWQSKRIALVWLRGAMRHYIDYDLEVVTQIENR
ncbi:MAG: BNR-4 repeat-containing protein [Bryobacterales bacterium]|nr:BNR-4 repeat-containing protein [Bryobacterales bacterium]